MATPPNLKPAITPLQATGAMCLISTRAQVGNSKHFNASSWQEAGMYRYYFDVLADGEFIADEEGMSLPDVNAARREAACSLADLARNAIRSKEGTRRMSILVRTPKGPHFEESFQWDSAGVH
jgi:hypothetical protein